MKFQSTPSARRATRARNFRHLRPTDFNPRPPRGGRHGNRGVRPALYLFQSTPSARRATGHVRERSHHQGISIHALREEGDVIAGMVMPCGTLFQSTPSARRATNHRGHDGPRKQISIHALREEGDVDKLKAPRKGVISIHALREEGDSSPAWTEVTTMRFQSTPSARRATNDSAEHVPDDAKFQSTPSARRATPSRARPRWPTPYFNPRPPRGGRLLGPTSICDIGDFNPRPPRGGRPGCNAGHNLSDVFQSTPSARRATFSF